MPRTQSPEANQDKTAQDLRRHLEQHQDGTIDAAAWSAFLLGRLPIRQLGNLDLIRIVWGCWLVRCFPDEYPSRPASRPTTALPRTPEKLREMRRRARRRESVFHRLDGPPRD